jgi:hypothetical protein
MMMNGTALRMFGLSRKQRHLRMTIGGWDRSYGLRVEMQRPFCAHIEGRYNRTTITKSTHRRYDLAQTTTPLKNPPKEALQRNPH